QRHSCYSCYSSPARLPPPPRSTLFPYTTLFRSYYRITGRVDDIIIVSGHNLGTAEIESAITEHSAVCECAVVGYPHDIKGQGIYTFVICYDKPHEEEKLRREILETVSKQIGPIAKPDK